MRQFQKQSNTVDNSVKLRGVLWEQFKWESLANSKDERVSLDAMKYLSDRLYGKPVQALDNKHSGEFEVIKRVISDL